MAEETKYVPPLPKHPDLREIAVAIEEAEMAGDILDAQFRTVFLATESARVLGLSAEEAVGMYGTSQIRRTISGSSDLVRVSQESGSAWFEHNVPIIRHYLKPEDEVFEEVFDATAPYAAEIEPIARPPRSWVDRFTAREDTRMLENLTDDWFNLHFRVSDDSGEFIGVVVLSRSTLPQNLAQRLAKGSRALLERMDRVSTPAKRAAAILFADLEASGDHSRRLSSRSYFEMIRSMTDLIDTSVMDAGGIVGKHAGDGASALFLAADFDGSESKTVLAAIRAARMINEGAAELGHEEVTPNMNVGLHWGSTLTVGQIATTGRLEVTALGDQMNECARIEAAAKAGAILGSKDLIERLDGADAQAAGLNPDGLAYTPLGEIDGVSEKAIRDAGAIAVTQI